MKVIDTILSPRLSLSFEVFPPKSETALEDVKHATEEIAAALPAYMSVTYGAGGAGGRFTLQIAQNIQTRFSVPVVEHLTCVGATREGILEKLSEMKRAGITNVLALRGDLPEGTVPDGFFYPHAADLVREIRAFDADFCIGGACYPETHPESADSREDIRFLKEKVDAGCDFLTTQMFFDNNVLYNFLYKIREAGIRVPVVPGIMPITSGTQVKRSIELSGSFMPRRFVNLVDKFGSSPEAMKQAGIAYATDQIIDLFANGFSHVHVYSMNKPDVARKILENLSDILAK